MDQVARDPLDVRRRRRRRGLLTTFIGCAALTIGAGVTSLAVFTDTQASDGTWTVGTIDLVTSPVTVFAVTGIMPGDIGSRTLTVTNNGTGDLRYAMTSSSDNGDGKGLRDQLTLQVRPGACPSVGADLYAGALSGAAFGDPTQGADDGDRALPAGASEDLCFSWSFPLASGNAFQGATVATTFTFDAEQTAGN
jgi:hypothetical protein